MRHLNALLNDKQYGNLMTLLREARDRAKDSILTCELEVEEIDELEEVLL
tara:strand:- start:332 stop:481 length:150 start_codon:yes stop_codon:yes gene_type:complete